MGTRRQSQSEKQKEDFLDPQSRQLLFLSTVRTHLVNYVQKSKTYFVEGFRHPEQNESQCG